MQEQLGLARLVELLEGVVAYRDVSVVGARESSCAT